MVCNRGTGVVLINLIYPSFYLYTMLYYTTKYYNYCLVQTNTR